MDPAIDLQQEPAESAGVGTSPLFDLDTMANGPTVRLFDPYQGEHAGRRSTKTNYIILHEMT